MVRHIATHANDCGGRGLVSYSTNVICGSFYNTLLFLVETDGGLC